MFDTPSQPQQEASSRHWAQTHTVADPEDRMIPFRATVTGIELDFERRPAREFSARTNSISRARLELHTRRMIYTGSPVLIILPLIDATPCVVGCLVTNCTYDSAGDYLIELEFSNYARSRFVDEWMENNGYSNFKPTADETPSSTPH